MNYMELRRDIDTFSLDGGYLGSQGYTRVLLQLFGYMGHGKSSFINSCKYVLDDGHPYIEYAKAGQTPSGGSMTMIRNAYRLTPKITIVDNRGLRAMTDFERAEVYAQLGNFYPLDQRVVWKETFEEAMAALEESDLDKNTTDFLVPILIYSAKCILPLHEQEDVKAFILNCDKMTGVIPIVVLTNKTVGDFFEVKKNFKCMGADTVIAIENYTTDSHVKSMGRTIDILKVIEKALENVEFCLDQPRDLEGDRKERKKFLLNYIHKAKLRKEEMSQKQERKEPWFIQKYCVLQ